MKATGNKPPAMVAARGAFQAGDLARSGEMFGAPLLTPPSNFFTEVARSILGVQRLLIAAQLNPAVSDEQVEALVDAITYNVHMNSEIRTADNDLIVDETFIAACLGKAGFTRETGSALVQGMSSSADVKATLKQNTEEAVARGAFGSPTMFIHPKEEGREPIMVFGSDRFEQIAHFCGLPYKGANPSKL